MAKSVLLIVVDNPAHRVLFSQYLKSSPHSLVFSTDGEDGFDRFSEVKPDLVIAHVNVARLDGTILCQLIRKEPGGEDVPIVLIGEEFADRALAEEKRKKVGADAFLPLPFNRKALTRCITPLLAFGRVMEEPDSEPGPEPELLVRDDPDPPTIPIPKMPDTASTPVVASKETDLDTVVSYQNPFYTAPVEVSRDLGESQEPQHAEEEAVTQLYDDAPAEATSDAVIDPAERAATPVVSGERVTTDPELVDPDPIDGDPPQTDKLVEPRIDTGVRRVDRPSDSQLIAEPKRETTPSRSDEQRVSQLRNAAAGQRRGLDESQLGKRLSKRVRTIFKLLEEVDYYQLLGVEPTAKTAAITSAYFDLSLEFHPDRFYLLRSGDLKEKIYDIYRKIGEGYRILSDPVTRERYDAGRARGEKSGVELIEPNVVESDIKLEIKTRSDDAARFVRLADEALGRGALNKARLHLHLAKTYDRENAQLNKALADVARKMRP